MTKEAKFEAPVRRNVKGEGVVPPSPRYGGRIRPPPDGTPRNFGLAYPPQTPRRDMKSDLVPAMKPVSSPAGGYGAPLLQLPGQTAAYSGVEKKMAEVVDEEE